MALLIREFDVSIHIVVTEPHVKMFVGLEFIGEVFLLGNKSLVILEVPVDVLLRSSLDNLK